MEYEGQWSVVMTDILSGDPQDWTTVVVLTDTQPVDRIASIEILGRSVHCRLVHSLAVTIAVNRIAIGQPRSRNDVMLVGCHYLRAVGAVAPEDAVDAPMVPTSNPQIRSVTRSLCFVRCVTTQSDMMTWREHHGPRPRVLIL